MSEREYLPLTLTLVKTLTDKLYEKRKTAALEIEKIVRELMAAQNYEQVERICKVLSEQFVLSQNGNFRRGGLIGIAALAIATGKEAPRFRQYLIPPVLQCFLDNDPKVRYYACESLYNIAKVLRIVTLAYFNEIFDCLAKLVADMEPTVKSGAELLDRLLKDIVTETCTQFELIAFIPILRERIYIRNPFTRQFLISLLTSVPELDMIQYLPEILDGLCHILGDPNPEIRKSCEILFNEFLSILKTSSIEPSMFEDMTRILIQNCQSTDDLIQYTSLYWLREFLNMSSHEVLLPHSAGLLAAILPSNDINQILRQLIKTESTANEQGKYCLNLPESTISKVVEVLKTQIQLGASQSRIIALQWVYHLFDCLQDKMSPHIDILFPVLFRVLSDSTDEAVLLVLQIFAIISTSNTPVTMSTPKTIALSSSELLPNNNNIRKYNDYFTKFIVVLMDLFRTDRLLLETRGSFIIRQLCMLLCAEDIYRTLSETLSNESDVQFASTMVKILSSILLTSTELHEFRIKLKDLQTSDSATLFVCLYKTWCHNPVATVALCLLSQNYDHACTLVQLFSDMEVTVDFLIEIDKLVQLIESPIFTYLRLALLDIENNQTLIRTLCGLLMLLPQTDAFHTLRRRLECVPTFIDKLTTSQRGTNRHFYLFNPNVSLTVGCGNTHCSNVYCYSSPSFKYDRTLFNDKNVAAVEAVKLSKEHNVELCTENSPTTVTTTLPSVGFNETILNNLLEECHKTDNWELFINTIVSIFSDRRMLSTSFLKKEFENKLLHSNAKNGDGDAIQNSNNTSAISKTKIYHDKIELATDELTLDFIAMRRAIKLLCTKYEDYLLIPLNKAIKTLTSNITLDLGSTQSIENDNNFLNIFFIIFEISYLSYPEYIFDCARCFYHSITKLSKKSQVKIIQIYSKMTSSDLSIYVTHLRQYLTMYTMIWVEHTTVNSSSEKLLSQEAGMKDGLDVLRIFFYSNLLGGKRDKLEVIKLEKEQDKLMSTEIIKRREQRNEDDDDETGLNNENNETMSRRMASNIENEEEDENPFDIDLQKAVGLEPNEYRSGLLSYDDFINEFVNEKIEIMKEYLNYYRQKASVSFSFIIYPFFLTTTNKIALLNIENKIKMYRERHTSVVHSLLGIRLNPYFKINVRRDHLIEDALIALEYQGIERPQELKKQLFVEFDGEQGVDEGGVSKEFFQLITEQVFKPEYGMFMFDEETRSMWFNPSAGDDMDREYTLIGMLIGLAIYNNIILDIKFAPVVYRKLMGKLGTFEDLEKSHPMIYQSLERLLSYNEITEGGNIEDIFSLTFRVSLTDATGSRLTYDLKEDGDNILVTNDNREEFIRLYSNFILNKSIEKQFNPFYHGFLLVTHGSYLRKLFRPDEVELLVAGSQVLDFDQLASTTEYDGGYSSEHPTIKNFWDIMNNLTDDQKRKFLRFTTGSDRTPIGGLAKLKLVIVRKTADTDSLPTAHTCFNALLLPEYSSKAKLQEKLVKAIQYAEGFGLM
ncbi:unnamed protein product [Didymodactylos carnosus]|uniref:Protein VAC14 homolog n=1 Tax=Didymodactylos carnosus TaxID=1234261 RepID=A0A813NVZ5_9BILA|nr:unnamed protein product [Didymodactylos carnosus]CAF0745892.1 unnamed protein product [Didymodactylos carnosus]CAF3506106.1 unnamed protein product [Didymodactylos carnosus]CAF3524631.1 unnamed protein product [Didymodactylos carnosus]